MHSNYKTCVRTVYSKRYLTWCRAILNSIDVLTINVLYHYLTYDILHMTYTLYINIYHPSFMCHVLCRIPFDWDFCAYSMINCD